MHGRIEHVAFDEVVNDEPWFGFDEALEWRDPDGTVLLRERRILLAHFADDDWYTVDLDSTHTAAHDVRLGDTFKSSIPGRPCRRAPCRLGRRRDDRVTGATGEEALMGNAADWIDCSGARNGQWSTPCQEGIAVFNHPENPPDGRWSEHDYGYLSPRPGHHSSGGEAVQRDELRLRTACLRASGGDAQTHRRRRAPHAVDQQVLAGVVDRVACRLHE